MTLLDGEHVSTNAPSIILRRAVIVSYRLPRGQLGGQRRSGQSGISGSQSSAPAPMQETFPWRKKELIGEKADDYDHNHDPDYLLHCIEFATIVQELA